MAQFSRPVSDVSTGAWSSTPLWSKLDDNSDADFVTSDDNTSPDTAELEGTNTGLTDPATSTGYVLRARIRKSASGGHSVTFNGRLYQGTGGGRSLIATVSETDGSTTFHTITHSLTSGEADAISDHNDLYFEIERAGDTGGPPGNRRAFDCAWVELEIPDATPPNLVQTDFRIRASGGMQDANGAGLNSDTGWQAAENAPVTADFYDQEFRIRFAIANTGGADTDTFELHYAKNGGSYFQIGNRATPWATSTSQAQKAAVPSQAYTDNAAASTSLLSGTGTFSSNGSGNHDNETASITIPAGGYIELEFCILLRKLSNEGSLADGDFYDFRIKRNGGTDLDTYTNTPRVTLDSTRGWIGGSRAETPVRDILDCGDHGLFAVAEYSDFTTGTFINELALLQSTDEGVTWNVVDESGRPGASFNDIESVDMAWDGNVAVHVVWHEGGNVRHAAYNIQSGAWSSVTTLESVTDPVEGQSVCCAIRQTDAALFAFWNYSDGTNDKIHWKKRTLAGAWDSTPTALDSTSSEGIGAPVAVGDSLGNVHVVYAKYPTTGRTATNGDLLWKKIDRDGNLTADGSRISLLTSQTYSGEGGNERMQHTPMICFDDAGTERIAICFHDLNNDHLYYAQSPVSSVSWSTEEQVSDTAGINDHGGGNDQVQADLCHDPFSNEVHVWWCEVNAGHLMHDVRSSGSFGTDVDEATPVNGDFQWVRCVFRWVRSNNTKDIKLYLTDEINGGATGAGYVTNEDLTGSVLGSSASTYSGDNYTEITDDQVFSLKSTTTAYQIPGMVWTPPASTTHLIVATIEIYWKAGALGTYIRPNIRDNNGVTIGYTNRYLVCDTDLDIQKFTVTTFALRTSAASPQDLDLCINFDSAHPMVWWIGKRTISFIPIDDADAFLSFGTANINTSSSDFSVTMTDMQATEGTSTMFDGSTTMPTGTYLLLFGCYAYKNTATDGAASEYRVYQAGSEVAAHLRRRVDWGGVLATANDRLPIFIPAVVTVGSGEVTSIRWANPAVASQIEAIHRALVMVKLSAADALMVGGTVEDSEVTADTYKAVDDLTHSAPGADDWMTLWSANYHADETTIPGEVLTFGVGVNGSVQASSERRQSYGDAMGATDDFMNVMGHGRAVVTTGNVDLRWKSDLTTSRSVLNRTLVLFRKKGTQSVAVGPAIGTWAGVTLGKTLGGVSAALGPGLGTWAGVPLGLQAQNDVPVGPAAGTWDAVPVTAALGGVTVAAQPAPGTWQAVPVSAVFGGLTILVTPAVGVWSGVLVGVSSGVTVAVGQALATWQGIALGLQATIDVAVGTALATWTGVPVSAVLGGLNVSVTPAPGTWQGVAVTVSTATVKVAGPALGTWQGVALTAALGGLNVSAGQALGTWQGVAVTPQTGTIVSVNPALGVWAGIQVVPSLGALIVPADPALGVWQSVNVPVSIAPLTIPADPASGSWLGIPVPPTVGGVTIPVGPSPGTWQGVQVVPQAGAQLVPVGIASGTWQGVATPVFIAPRSFPMTAALATWIGVPVSSVLGAVLVPVGPALGTWVAGQAQVLFFVELLIEEGHSVDVLRAWAADAARDWASDAVRIYSSDE